MNPRFVPDLQSPESFFGAAGVEVFADLHLPSGPDAANPLSSASPETSLPVPANPDAVAANWWHDADDDIAVPAPDANISYQLAGDVPDATTPEDGGGIAPTSFFYLRRPRHSNQRFR